MEEKKELVQKENISETVLSRVKDLEDCGGLVLPKNYSAANALKFAWLTLQNVKDKGGVLAINSCTKESIANALLEMVTKGLSPAKHQCYFIPMGTQLTLFEDYRGKLMRAKRDTGIIDVNANVIYEGDKFTYSVNSQNGRLELKEHIPSIDNIDITKIKGGYAIVVYADGSTKLEVMTMKQIKQSWMQGAAKGGSGAHSNFTDQMVKKTVITRACKIELDSSDDSSIVEDDEDVVINQRNEQIGLIEDEPVVTAYEEITEQQEVNVERKQCPI